MTKCGTRSPLLVYVLWVPSWPLASSIEYTTRCRLRSRDCCCSAEVSVCAGVCVSVTPTHCGIPYEFLVKQDGF